MQLSRWFGAWTLWGHDGTYQGSSYMDGVWRKAIRFEQKRGLDVRRCLILGVAMGSTFNLVQRAWPDADIVGVDWEPELFALGVKIGIFRPDSRVQFIEGDAVQVVPALNGEFDFVIVDLFNGREVAEAVADPALQDAVVARLAPGAIVAVNCYRQKYRLDGWVQRLGTPIMLKYVQNWIGVFGR